MAQLSETFPTLDCAQCILTPRTVEVGHHERIRLHTYSEVEAIEGEVGDFRVRIRRHAAYVDWETCTGCGLCQEKCPTDVGSEFERGVGETRACGTGAAAAVAIGRRWELLGSRVAVELPGGTLRVEWQGPGTDLWQTGPTTKVYEGRIDI